MGNLTVTERFADFQRGVSSYLDRVDWIIEHLDCEQEGVHLLGKFERELRVLLRDQVLEEGIPDDAVTSIFDRFHSDVGVYSEHVGWILSKLNIDQEGVELLLMLRSRLELLIDGAVIRP